MAEPGEDGISQPKKTRTLPPARSVEAAHSALSTVPGSHAASPAKPPAASAHHSHALPVYAINLQELVKSTLSLSQLPHVGWRYLWKQSRHCSSVEVARTFKKKRNVATTRSRGPVNTRLIRAVERATKSIGKDKYAVRLLSAPPLVYSAVWLKSFRHRADKVIVVETIAPKIHSSKVYPIGEFLDLLRPDATMLVEHTQRIKLSQQRAAVENTKT